MSRVDSSPKESASNSSLLAALASMSTGSANMSASASGDHIAPDADDHTLSIANMLFLEANERYSNRDRTATNDSTAGQQPNNDITIHAFRDSIDVNFQRVAISGEDSAVSSPV